MGKLEVSPIHLIGRLDHPDYVHIDFFSENAIKRATALQSILRYNFTEHMTHRPTDFAHSVKVPFFGFYMSQICMELGLPLDQPKIVYMGQHHDDADRLYCEISPPRIKSVISFQMSVVRA